MNGPRDKETGRQGDPPAPRLPVSWSPCLLVFLIGYRGTGKTTTARLLAEHLGWEWVDADIELERRAGRSIKQIFAEDNEAAFRDLETAALKDLCARQRCVIATGGGVVLRAENCERMRASGTIISLTADTETIWQRLQQDSLTVERRPALTVGGRAEVEQLLGVREPLYRACADLVVDTAGRASEEIVKAIVAALRLPT